MIHIKQRFLQLGIDRRITRPPPWPKKRVKPPGVLGIVATLQLGAQLNSGTVGNTFRTPGNERINIPTWKWLGFQIWEICRVYITPHGCFGKLTYPLAVWYFWVVIFRLSRLVGHVLGFVSSLVSGTSLKSLKLSVGWIMSNDSGIPKNIQPWETMRRACDQVHFDRLDYILL